MLFLSRRDHVSTSTTNDGKDMKYLNYDLLSVNDHNTDNLLKDDDEQNMQEVEENNCCKEYMALVVCMW